MGDPGVGTPWRTHVRIWLSWGFSDLRAKQRQETTNTRPESGALSPKNGCPLNPQGKVLYWVGHIPSAGETVRRARSHTEEQSEHA